MIERIPTPRPTIKERMDAITVAMQKIPSTVLEQFRGKTGDPYLAALKEASRSGDTERMHEIFDAFEKAVDQEIGRLN